MIVWVPLPCFLGSSPSQGVPGYFQEVQLTYTRSGTWPWLRLPPPQVSNGVTMILPLLPVAGGMASLLGTMVAGSYYSSSHFGLRRSWHCAPFGHPLWITGQGHARYPTNNWDQAAELDWVKVLGIVKGLFKTGYNASHWLFLLLGSLLRLSPCPVHGLSSSGLALQPTSTTTTTTTPSFFTLQALSRTDPMLVWDLSLALVSLLGTSIVPGLLTARTSVLQKGKHCL